MSKERDIEIMTATLWMEARGESDEGIQAVACVIYNRYKANKWYSKVFGRASLANVCLKKWQFSCWNPGGQCETRLPYANKQSEKWKKCKEFATMAVYDKLPDIVAGADHYYAMTMTTPPSWVYKMKFIRQIGNHRFYKDESI